MSAATRIEWADSTFNPWIGCTKISPGCDHCYAERQMDQRLGRVRWGAGQPRQRTSAAYWRQPELWNAEADRFRECGACGWRGQIEIGASPVPFACPRCDAVDWRAARRRVFCASLADVFDNEVPLKWLMDLLDLTRRTPNLDWLLLTKRAGNVTTRLGAVAGLAGKVGEEGDKAASDTWGMAFDWLRDSPPENVWLGATVVNQAEADRDIPKLLATPAALRFISVEPMLGPIDVARWMRPRQSGNPDGYGGDHAPGWTTDTRTLDWVIAGGESGPGARPMHPDWVRSLRDQCQAAGVPFMLKQWGEWAWELREYGPNGEPWSHKGEYFRRRSGKHAAGRLLDGREWLEFPA